MVSGFKGFGGLGVWGFNLGRVEGLGKFRV